LCKTTKKDTICGGYTSKSWGGGSGRWVRDEAAFVFNMRKKFVPNNYDCAIHFQEEGITFGRNILRIVSDPLNQEKGSSCHFG
jgi:hypothetical protein